MTPAFIKQRLRDAGLNKCSDDERLLEWIVKAVNEAAQTVTKPWANEAIVLLRESPTRHAMDRCCDKSPTHRYWPWRRRVEDFLVKVDSEG